MSEATFWSEVQEVFDEASLLPSEKVEGYLKSCVENEHVRYEVLRLLEAPATVAAALEDLQARPVDNEPAALLPGSFLDRYRIIKQLGMGGMGTVYLAEDSAAGRRIALKTLRGKATKLQLQEVQHLGRLDHTGISRLLTYGLTDDGCLYIVLQFIDGERLLDHCKKNKLSLKARLELFVQICSAVAHAHNNAVVHRDLKPANILVTEAKKAKLIDFGIAGRASGIGPPAGGHAPAAFTLPYASPEQINHLPVAPATDIYSLGVILCELITGYRPHTSAEGESLRQAILTGQIRLPSAILAENHGKQTPPSASPEEDPEPLILPTKIEPELDTIVVKCLRVDARGRFSSVTELRDTIEAFLERRPVAVYSTDPLYRLRKNIHRRWPWLVAGFFGLAVVVFYILALRTATENAERARDEAKEQATVAEQTAQLLVDVFEEADPWKTSGDDLPASKILRSGAERALQDEGLPLDVRVRVLQVTGEAFGNLGEYSQAEELLRRAIRVDEEAGRTGSVSLGETKMLLGQVLDLGGDTKAGIVIQEQARAVFEAVLGKENARTSQVLKNLAESYETAGELEKAEAMYLDVLSTRRSLLGEEHEDTADSLTSLGSLYRDLERFDEAEALMLEGLDIQLAVLGAEHPATSHSLNEIAVLYDLQGKYKKAEDFYARALKAKKRLSENHPSILLTKNNIAVMHRDRGNLDKAEELYREVLKGLRSVVGDEHPETARALYNLGDLMIDRREYDQSERLLRESLELRRRLLGKHHPLVANSLNALAYLMHLQERYEEAETLHLESLSIVEEVFGREHSEYILRAVNLASLYSSQGRYVDAAEIYEASLPTIEGGRIPTSATTAMFKSNFGYTLTELKDLDRAERLLQEALAELEDRFGTEHRLVGVTKGRLGRVALESGDYPEARALLSVACPILEATKSVENPDTQRCLERLARVQSLLVASPTP